MFNLQKYLIYAAFTSI
ncbi:unnamed protein product [Leptidea sinapis]|uniref:Uncharacterized protein n=1 Tax=Leptidea sinapis TaxID=189913 RepID=A0A5E4R8M2_9NEOP|nr:unnamed protein product [Leptidea sinapis]